MAASPDHTTGCFVWCSGPHVTLPSPRDPGTILNEERLIVFRRYDAAPTTTLGRRSHEFSDKARAVIGLNPPTTLEHPNPQPRSIDADEALDDTDTVVLPQLALGIACGRRDYRVRCRHRCYAIPSIKISSYFLCLANFSMD